MLGVTWVTDAVIVTLLTPYVFFSEGYVLYVPYTYTTGRAVLIERLTFFPKFPDFPEIFLCKNFLADFRIFFVQISLMFFFSEDWNA